MSSVDRFVMTMGCGTDSNANSTFCKVRNESSDESSVSAPLATDNPQTAVLMKKLEEYERVICQQQELLLQVTCPVHQSLYSQFVNAHTSLK